MWSQISSSKLYNPFKGVILEDFFLTFKIFQILIEHISFKFYTFYLFSPVTGSILNKTQVHSSADTKREYHQKSFWEKLKNIVDFRQNIYFHFFTFCAFQPYALPLHRGLKVAYPYYILDI